jgi:hypothetical protein
MKIIEDEQEGSLDELIIRARKDPKIRRAILAQTEKDARREDWFRLLKVSKRAVELIENVEDVIGFQQHNGMLRSKADADDWSLRETYLMAFAYSVLGSLEDAKNLLDKCKRHELATLGEYAANALVTAILSRPNPGDRLRVGLYAVKDNLRTIEKTFPQTKPFSEDENNSVLFKSENRIDTLDNMMLAVAYEIAREPEHARQLYDGVNSGAIAHSAEDSEMLGLHYINSSFFKVTPASNAFVALYEIMTKRDPRLIKKIETAFDFKEYKGKKFIGFDEQPKTIDNIALALAYMAEDLYLKNETQNNR